MFTKDKLIAQGTTKVTKKVIDWDAVWGAVIIGGILIAVIANL
jgi:hypothetical protein